MKFSVGKKVHNSSSKFGSISFYVVKTNNWVENNKEKRLVWFAVLRSRLIQCSIEIWSICTTSSTWCDKKSALKIKYEILRRLHAAFELELDFIMHLYFAIDLTIDSKAQKHR